jgi:hypothetical protein
MPSGESVLSLTPRFTSCFLFRSHRADAEWLGAVAEENQRAGADVGQLVVFFRGEKDDVVSLKDPFVALERKRASTG